MNRTEQNQKSNTKKNQKMNEKLINGIHFMLKIHTIFDIVLRCNHNVEYDTCNQNTGKDRKRK